MVKKVILEPQERFDIVDALGLQQGPLDTIARTLGGLMGLGAGTLTPVSAITPAGTTHIAFSSVFTFYQTVDRERGLTGQVVHFDPTNPAQTVTTIDYAAARIAAQAYYDANPGIWESLPQSDRGLAPADMPPAGDGSCPFVWARARFTEGSQEARRQWSVALQTEAPVTMNTRELTYVEFTLSDSVEGPADDENGRWAPILRVIGWEPSGIADFDALTTPVLSEISVFDALGWFRYTTQPGYDLDGDNDLDDFWTAATGGASVSQLVAMGQDRDPYGSRWHTLFGFPSGFALDALDGPFIDWLKGAVLPTVFAGGQLSVYSPFSASATRPDTAGLIDLLYAMRAVIANLASGGLITYPASGGTDDEHPLAPLRYSMRSVRGLTAVGAPQTIASATLAAGSANAKMYAVGAPVGSWMARPLRDMGTLAIEQVVQNDTIRKLEADLTAADALIADVTSRVAALEAGNPFQNVPINSAGPLVPIASVNFVSRYGQRGSMEFRCGPPDAIEEVTFVVDADMFSLTNHASGYVEIELSAAGLQSAGVTLNELRSGYCPIVATPVHIESAGSWLTPFETVYAGNVETPADFAAASSLAYDHQEKAPAQVLRQFANFFSCTLNVVVMRSGKIRVYPVSSVPDIVSSGDHLRGYPHIEQVRHFSKNNANGGQAGQPPEDWLCSVDGVDTGVERGFELYGDVTNPVTQLRGELSATVAGHAAPEHPVGTDQNIPSLPDTLVWGTRVDPATGRMVNDDLRGVAPRMTFLRPDRYHYGYPDSAEQYDNDRPQLFNNSGTRTLNHDEATLANSPGGPTAAELRVGDGARVMNGRFMPSFSLVVHRPAYAHLGGPATTHHLGPGLRFQARGGLQPPAARPQATFSVGYNTSRPDALFRDGTAPGTADASGTKDTANVGRLFTGSTSDEA